MLLSAKNSRSVFLALSSIGARPLTRDAPARHRRPGGTYRGPDGMSSHSGLAIPAGRGAAMGTVARLGQAVILALVVQERPPLGMAGGLDTAHEDGVVTAVV